MGHVVVDEVHGQHTFEHSHLVYVAVEHVFLRVLVNVGGAERNLVAHDAAQAVGD